MNKKQIKKLGDILTIANPLLCLLIVLLFYRTIINISIIICTYIIGNCIVQIIKGITDSSRPREGGKYEVIKIHGYSHKDGESCCSGHAMSAIICAYFLLFYINVLLSIPFIILGYICAWTRIKVKAHWLFDVILSNIIAITIMIISQWFLFCIEVL